MTDDDLPAVEPFVAFVTSDDEAPEYTKYLQKTDREIPVVRLSRR